MLLYLLSDTNQRGILEFDYEDNLWFNTLCKRYRAEFNLLVDSIKLEEKLMDKYRREIKKYVLFDKNMLRLKMKKNKVFVDETGETFDMSPEELFEFLKLRGYIDRNQKFEDWKYKRIGED